MNKILLVFCSLTLLVSCSKKQDEEEGAEEFFSGYKVVTVQNGGSVTGSVANVDSQSYPVKLAIQRDQPVCGDSHPNPSAPGSAGVQGCVVWLEGIREGKDYAYNKAPKLEQKECAFLPHVQVIAPGTTMLVTNDDPALHNYHVTTGGTTITNEAQPEGTPPHELTLKKPGLHQIVCDVHPWMKGFVMVADHPYYAVTDPQGNFSIDGIPPGTYTLKLWRDDWHIEELKNEDGRIVSYKWKPDLSKEMQVTIEAGKQATVALSLP